MANQQAPTEGSWGTLTTAPRSNLTYQQLQLQLDILQRQNVNLLDQVDHQNRLIGHLETQVDEHEQTNANLHARLSDYERHAYHVRGEADALRAQAVRHVEDVQQRVAEVNWKEAAVRRREVAVFARENEMKKNDAEGKRKETEGGEEEGQQPRKKVKVTHDNLVAAKAARAGAQDWRANVEDDLGAAPPSSLPHDDSFAGIGQAPGSVEDRVVQEDDEGGQELQDEEMEVVSSAGVAIRDWEGDEEGEEGEEGEVEGGDCEEGEDEEGGDV